MSEIKNSFVFYGSWWQNIHEMYSDDKDTCMRLIYAISQYGMTGVKTFPCERMFLMQCYSQIDSAEEKWLLKCEKNKENGKKGGRPPKKKPNGFLENPQKPNGFLENPSNSISDSIRNSENTSENNSTSINNTTSDAGNALTATSTEADWFDSLEEIKEDVSV